MAIKDEPCAQTHTERCTNTCTNVGSHSLSLRQQLGADLLISIATFTAVGDGDITKIDCHKKATVQQKELDGVRGVI